MKINHPSMPPSPAFSSLWPTQSCCWCARSTLKLRQLRHSPTAHLALLEVKPTNDASATLRHPFQSMLFGGFRAASSYCLRACSLMMSILGEIIRCDPLMCTRFIRLRMRRLLVSLLFGGLRSERSPRLCDRDQQLPRAGFLSCPMRTVVLRNRRNSAMLVGFHLRYLRYRRGISCCFSLAYALVESTVF